MNNSYSPLSNPCNFKGLTHTRPEKIISQRARVMWVRGDMVALAAGRLYWESGIDPQAPVVYLSSDDRYDYFVIDDDATQLRPHGQVDFCDVRQCVPVLDAAEMVYIWRALAFVAWHHRARFCETCGEPLQAAQLGRVRQCAAGHIVFPRHDPAVIMGILDPDERLLVARNRRWQPGRISVLAGFVEAGESAEYAVARETFEEAGVRVLDVRYAGSQAWPFPRSYMLAFYGWTSDTTPRINDGELAEVFFVEREELQARVATEELTLPGPTSLGRALINQWITGDNPHRLG